MIFIYNICNIWSTIIGFKLLHLTPRFHPVQTRCQFLNLDFRALHILAMSIAILLGCESFHHSSFILIDVWMSKLQWAKNRERIWIKAKYLCSYVPRFRGNIGYCAVCKYTEKWKLWSQKVGASNGERILEKIWGICQNTDFLWNGIDLTWVLIIICSKPESGSFSSQKILLTCHCCKRTISDTVWAT